MSPAGGTVVLTVPAPYGRIVGVSIGVVLVGAALWLVGSALHAVAVVTYALLVSLLLTSLLQPVQALLRTWRLPRLLATLLTVLGGIGIVLGAAALLVDQLTASVGVLGPALAASTAQLQTWTAAAGVDLPWDDVADAVSDHAAELAQRAAGLFGNVAQLLAGALLSVVVVFFLLLDGPRLTSSLLSVAPLRHRGRLQAATQRGWQALGGTVRGLVVVAVTDAVLIGLSLAVIGVPGVTALAVLVFLTAFIPVLGAVASGAVITLVALLAQGPTAAALALVVVVVVNQLDAHVLQPLVMARAASLHPVAIILLVAAGASAWGVAGALFAVPAAAFTVAALGSLTPPEDTRTPPDLTNTPISTITEGEQP